jgi:DDE superfamily endonuclease
LTGELDSLLAATTQATSDPRCALRLRQHMKAVLLCPEEATVTNLIRLNGQQHRDWSPNYRLYSRDRVDENVLFGEVLAELDGVLPQDKPLVVALDDTLVRKTGQHISGVAWRRDPLGPPFQTNLVRGQRYLQASAAWPLEDGAARMVPVAFTHAPPAPKPPREATAEQLAEHRHTQRRMSLNTRTIAQIDALRGACPAGRRLVFCGDATFTNAEVVGHAREHAVYIGRIRKDAVLHHPPASNPDSPSMGRPRRYGDKAPTPEQLRQDDSQPWRTVSAFAAGKVHGFRIKTLDKVLWKPAGHRHTHRVVVIAPVGYRLRAGSKLLYRQPAYLLCTDETLPLGELVQYYLWRWGIEVNFREEKSLLGAGDAHVRTAASNQHLPAVIVAAYALLWVALLRLKEQGRMPMFLQDPRWRKRVKSRSDLPTTGDLLRTLRFEEWARASCKMTFGHFASGQSPDTKSTKPPLQQNHKVRQAV